MNREIEFRIWDKKEKEMYEIDLCDLAEGDDYWYDGETTVWDTIYDSVHEQNRFVLMQYTGLTDKNGKKIFEGNIVKRAIFTDKVEYEYYKIEWIKDLALWGFIVIQEENFDIRHELYKIANECEVIGNIYEDKVESEELNSLEEEKKIPEKIDNEYFERAGSTYKDRLCKDKINEIIDYLKSKGE